MVELQPAVHTGDEPIRERAGFRDGVGVAGFAATEPARAGRGDVVAEVAKLSDDEEKAVRLIHQRIGQLWQEVPRRLRHFPESQARCLDHLSAAETALLPTTLTRERIIDARRAIATIDIELQRQRTSFVSLVIVACVVYLFVAAMAGFYATTDLFADQSAEAFNAIRFGGIPLPVLLWAVVGSLTSMLFRAGSYPFGTFLEALRWLIFRPLVGVVMGVLTYLMVKAGLIVFAADGETRAPELIWVIAFIGAFSDTLSVRLMQRLLGRFGDAEKAPAAAAEAKPATAESEGARPSRPARF